MNIIDFDARFTEVLNKWIEENRHRFRRPEDMEDEVPDVYLRWLNTPADWLEGCAPGSYFERFSDSAELCGLMCAYIKEGVPVPDPLLDRLAELGDEAALMMAGLAPGIREVDMDAVKRFRRNHVFNHIDRVMTDDADILQLHFLDAL